MNRPGCWEKFPIIPSFIRANREAAPGHVGSAGPHRCSQRYPRAVCAGSCCTPLASSTGVASAALSGMHFLIDLILFCSGKANALHYFPFTVITKTKLFEVSRR